VPVVPFLGIVSALFLMSRLSSLTWTVMIVWLLFGLVIYFGYSVKHSKVQKLASHTVGK
jgi:APA family basic amino acid/polyamine antiporter